MATCQPSAAEPTSRDGDGVARLRAILERLRGPDGCPWDREQTLESLKPCLLEECHELLEVMESETLPEAHAEELGDVLLQVALQAHLRAERGDFTLDDVAHRLCDKLVRRHPHVFASDAAVDSAAVLRNWEAIKRAERVASRTATSVLAGVPKALPALLRAQRVQAKASRAGFDWPDASGPRTKVAAELAELDAAIAAKDTAAIHHEVGDVLFSLVNLCRFLQVDAEGALRDAVARFSQRVQAVEANLQREGRTALDCTPDELDRLWEEAKSFL